MSLTRERVWNYLDEVDNRNVFEKHLDEIVNRTWNYANRQEDWKDAVMNCALGIAGEAGEVVDVVKKDFFHAERDRRDDLINEMGDLMFYQAKLMELYGITAEECLAANAAKIRARHGVRFASEPVTKTVQP